MIRCLSGAYLRGWLVIRAGDAVVRIGVLPLFGSVSRFRESQIVMWS